MKTVFISIISGVEAKNLLRTNVISSLLERPDVRVVLFVRTSERAEFYRREFSDQRLIYEVAPEYEPGRVSRFFQRIRHYLINTRSQKLYKKLAFRDRRNFIAYAASSIASMVLAHRPVRRLVRLGDRWLVPDRPFAGVFVNYRPDRVFLANLFDGTEIDLLREAQRRGVASVGFINSWDKVTSKGFVRLLPDVLLVPNALVREESRELLDMAEKHMVVVGLPQYDAYAARREVSSREVFFARTGLDPAKKLIVVAPAGSSFGTTDCDIAELLVSLVESGRIVHPVSGIMRFQPNDFSERTGFPARPWLRYESPGTRFTVKRGMDWDMSAEETVHLKDMLAHADLFITYGSSIGIDAAVFDKPVVVVDFEISPSASYLARPTLRYGTEHLTKALAAGGMRRARSRDELAAAINDYLGHPEHDRIGRARLVAEQCWRVDGKAGERISAAIIGAVKK